MCSCEECSKVHGLILSFIHSMKRLHTQSHNPSKAPSFNCLQKASRALISEKILSKHLTDFLLRLSKTCQTKCTLKPTCWWIWIWSPFPVILREASFWTMDPPQEAMDFDDLEKKALCPTLLVGVMIVWKERRKKTLLGMKRTGVWKEETPITGATPKCIFLRFIS